MARILVIPRRFLRLVSLLALGAGLWLAVLDAARSIAAGERVLTPLRQSWAATWPEGLAGVESRAGTPLPAFLQEHILLPLLGFPGWPVLGAISILLGMAGYQAGAGETRETGVRAA